MSSNPESLTVLLAGQITGRVERDRRGRLLFTYDPEWRGSSGAIPLSLSMPLVAAEHDHDPVEAFMCGLLPDNRDVLAAWGRRFQVSPRNPIALLTYVGEDCAGAVQFVREERLDFVLNDRAWEVEWLDDAGVEARLRGLHEDRSAWRASGDTGQFSLAGAQSKIALLRQDERCIGSDVLDHFAQDLFAGDHTLREGDCQAPPGASGAEAAHDSGWRRSARTHLASGVRRIW